ncbi:MAG: RdgB/HAM1 family non-canonical purine NTP pyrophosphatase [Candidatus Eisenbacteria bacterium]|nr:RdgB/HAM1 family non-canonical purine NTP pyrophosphatase [Candidatus Eisenbacteria bacterium]
MKSPVPPAEAARQGRSQTECAVCPHSETLSIVLATRNRHKIAELTSMLSDLPVQILSLDRFPDMPAVVEDGETLEENAIKKAVAVASVAGIPSLADDTGLEVAVLKGAPGVRSARYAGADGNTAANNRRLLDELDAVPVGDRRASFRCVIALARTDGTVSTVEGVTTGVILTTPRGHGGFGYDPLFLPDGHDRTYAEMSSSEKNAVSHRGKAIKAARGLVLALLEQGSP